MKKNITAVIAILFVFPVLLKAQEEKPAATDAAELAKKLANPVASLISMPFQNNLDVGIGEFNGTRNTLNIQPVIPIKLSVKLNLITRVVLPVVSQYDIYEEGSHEGGLGDAIVSAFFSPAEAKNGLVLGSRSCFACSNCNR